MVDSDVVLSMILCSMFLQDVPMNFREKVILCVLILKYMNLYIKTEEDLIWVNRQIEEQSRSLPSQIQDHEI